MVPPLQYQGRTDQLRAAANRRLDAEILRRQGRWIGAMYMRGYGIECLLKAQLMIHYDVWTLEQLEARLEKRSSKFKSLRRHELEFLFDLAGLQKQLKSHPLRRAFSVCNRWSTSWRYSSDDGTSMKCEEFFAEAEVLEKFIAANL